MLNGYCSFALETLLIPGKNKQMINSSGFGPLFINFLGKNGLPVIIRYSYIITSILSSSRKNCKNDFITFQKSYTRRESYSFFFFFFSSPRKNRKPTKHTHIQAVLVHVQSRCHFLIILFYV